MDRWIAAVLNATLSSGGVIVMLLVCWRWECF